MCYSQSVIPFSQISELAIAAFRFTGVCVTSANWRIGLNLANRLPASSAKRQNGALKPYKSTKVVSQPIGETAKPLCKTPVKLKKSETQTTGDQ